MKSEGLKTRAHLFIEGRVQGVFFRASTEETSLKYGVTGWVRNCPDGKVEALFEGDKDSVAKAVEWCKHGPPSAIVTNVEVKWDECSGEFSCFSIRY